MIPGELLPADGTLELLGDRDHVTVRVVNTGDRPVQVGSHYHFAESNPALDFDRAAAWGTRLDIASGTAVRFEPGVERDVELVALGGARRVPGLRRAAAGSLDDTDVAAALERADLSGVGESQR